MATALTKHYSYVVSPVSAAALAVGMVIAPVPNVDAGLAQLAQAAVRLQVSTMALSVLAGADGSSVPLQTVAWIPSDPDSAQGDAPLTPSAADPETIPENAIDALSPPAPVTDTSWTTDTGETAVTQSIPEALINVALSFGVMVVLAPVNILLSPLLLLIPLALPLLDTSSCRYLVCAVGPFIVAGLIGAVTIGPAAGFLGSLYDLWNTIFPPAAPVSASAPAPAAAEPGPVPTAETVTSAPGNNTASAANEDNRVPTVSESTEAQQQQQSPKEAEAAQPVEATEPLELPVLSAVNLRDPSPTETSPSSVPQTDEPSSSSSTSIDPSSAPQRPLKLDAVRNAEPRNSTVSRQHGIREEGRSPLKAVAVSEGHLS